jgi:hypothetical protein
MKRFPLFVCLVLLLLVMTAIPATASPTISRISPATAPNDGDVTVTITGTGFNSNSTVKINSQYTLDAPLYGTIVSWSPTSIICTFPIRGKTPTRYTVWVNSPFTNPFGTYFPEDVGLLTNGFEITQGTVTIATTRTTPLPMYGTILVSSIPSGANIYLDNEYKGLTTLIVKNVENGNHVVLVRLTGYRDWTQNVEVLGNSPSVSARLVAIPATTTATTTIPKIYITDTTPVAPVPTTRSPSGIEIGIIATIGAALLTMRRK